MIGLEEQAPLTNKLRLKAFELGFELFGVAPIAPHPELAFFEKWLQRGYGADMAYLERHRERRTHPETVVANAKSVIVCAKNYHANAPLSTDAAPADSGWIARYAWGDDYHDVLKKRIAALYAYLRELTQNRASGRYYVDTGPVVERVWAKYAGIGWIAKNTCVINQALGSYFFLAAIITDIPLRYNEPVPDRCGTCRRCIDACPTSAIVQPYVLDASLCISYFTIERRGGIPVGMRDKIGRHVFGCDICQDVCPWNSRAPYARDPEFQPRRGNVNPQIQALLQIDVNAYRERFRGSPVKRAKFLGILRNALIAAGNSRSRVLVPLVKQFLEHDDEMIREHAEWACDKLASAPN